MEVCQRCKELERAMRRMFDYYKDLEKYAQKMTPQQSVGRPSIAKEKVSLIKQLKRAGHSCREISDMTGMSKSTVSKYWREKR